MQVILTEEVRGLGNAGEILNVKDGFGRNYLIPNKLAILATNGNVKVLEHQKKVIADKQNKLKREAEKVTKAIEELTCVIACQTGEEGKLFGSVTSMDIEKYLRDKGFAVDKRDIHLDYPIKSIGDYTIKIRLHHDVKANLHLSVTKAE